MSNKYYDELVAMIENALSKAFVVPQQDYKELYEAMSYSVLGGGNTAVPLDRDLPVDDLIYNVTNSGCKAIVYSKVYADVAQKLKELDSGIPSYSEDNAIKANYFIPDGHNILEKLFIEK